MLWEITVLVAILWVVQRRWQMRRQTALGKQLKTKIKAYPFIGQSYKFFGTDEDRSRAWEEFGRDAIEAGGISKFLHFDHVDIMVADPTVAEVVLSQCLEKHYFMKLMHVVIGNASLISSVPIWRHRRKINAPTFSSKNVLQFVEVFSKQSIEMVNLLEKEVDKGTFSIWEYIVINSMNVVCETAMGVNAKLDVNQMLEAVEELMEIAGQAMTSKIWLQNKLVYQCSPIYSTVLKKKEIIFNFVIKVIEEKKCKLSKMEAKEPHLDNKAVSSFLDTQLDPSNGPRKFSDLELIEETLLLIVAGYDTSATSVGFVILMMSRHADVQDKVYKEQQEVFGESERAVTHEDLPRLKYLDAVIKETLRLHPVAPIVARQADSDVQLPSGITLVKGCGAVVNIWAIHRNPAYWGDDADQFRPERFLDLTLKHPAAFMPFSYGPRGCIGYRFAMLMLKTTLATLLRRYRVLAPPGVPQGATPKSEYKIFNKHVDNYEIQLEHRNK